MTVLTATANLAARTVRLDLAGHPAAGPVQIWRTDDNGTRRVRLPAGAAADGAGAYTATDHEASLTGTLDYVAADGTDTTTLADPARVPDTWIHAAAYPTTLPTSTGALILDWRPTRDTGAQLHEPIGRADTIDTGGPARLRSHTIGLRFPDLAAALELEQLVTAARCIVMRQAVLPGLDSTLTVETIDGPYPDTSVPGRWRVELRGRETLTGPPILEVTP